MTKTFVHVGSQPIWLNGTWHQKGDEVVADPKDVEFFVTIGALEPKQAPIVPFTTDMEG